MAFSAGAIALTSNEEDAYLIHSPEQSPSSPAVTVVVVTKGEHEISCPANLCNQSHREPFEVIAVSGGNRSQARNRGIAESRGPLVAFIDADCEPPTDWLARLVEALPSDEKVAGAGGVSNSRKLVPTFGRAVDAVFSTYLGSLNSPSLVSFPSHRKEFAQALSCHNSIFRKQALLEIGGFDERFELNEDTDISIRLRRRGYKLVVDRNVFVYHRRRSTWSGFVKQFFWYGVGRTRSMLTDRRFVDRRILLLLLGTLAAFILGSIRPVLIVSLSFVYLILILGSSLGAARRIRETRLTPRMVSIFAVEHLTYFVGLICGAFFGPWRKSSEPKSIIVSRFTFHNG